VEVPPSPKDHWYDVMRSFDSVAALEGYHAINIDYPNNRNTASFINSTDKAAFNKFRQELDFGTPVSDSVNVDSLNSIVNRITKLVIYLAKTRPGEGWNNFLNHELSVEIKFEGIRANCGLLLRGLLDLALPPP